MYNKKVYRDARNDDDEGDDGVDDDGIGMAAAMAAAHKEVPAGGISRLGGDDAVTGATAEAAVYGRWVRYYSVL